MDSLTDDICALVLAKLPIKIFTVFKLVCKQWKSISLRFSVTFSCLCTKTRPLLHGPSCPSCLHRSHPEMVDYYYQCDTWGLKRPLGSFIKSFLNDKNLNHKYVQVSAVAYSDVGWILIYAMSKIMEKSSLYVANPVSHECVEIFIDPLPKGVERSLWSLDTSFSNYYYCQNSISLNGNLHWLARNNDYQ
ncbi:LOW QUALITY PROTEIN: hypothetical protein HID58_078056 [Brassica napus]|uniref:F-box domain-containing protein n=1 Tax=Brassica napus TaxID=3708 RepID=A0ABQ7YT31_BRANA|nr:LOW QUALITY PROTEIN: hypothetical protein HID58_078056 [Brassica napus]